MAPEPLVQPLSHRNRTFVFRLLVAIFLCAMPVFVFYAMGYRIDFSDSRNIITVGGLYVSADVDDVEMYVNESPVVNMRIFQNAAYIQNLEAGTHRVHVQRDGLQTWVKELPVYAHLVTEAHAFNMPLVPQIRFIPRWIDENGLPILIVKSTAEDPFAHASTTNTIMATTTTNVSRYTPNSEYDYAESLFAAATSTVSSPTQRAVDVFQSNFMWSDQYAALNTTTATTTKYSRDRSLFERNGEIYAAWTGTVRSIPYYYCVNYTSATTTTMEYGAHVYESLIDEFGADTLTDLEGDMNRVCRSEIRIDRKGQKVTWFDFVPNSQQHVLMLLEDGLYVVEADDRSWQNVQLLYPGDDLAVTVDGGQIYVFDGTHYFEVLTVLQNV